MSLGSKSLDNSEILEIIVLDTNQKWHKSLPLWQIWILRRLIHNEYRKCCGQRQWIGLSFLSDEAERLIIIPWAFVTRNETCVTF